MRKIILICLTIALGLLIIVFDSHASYSDIAISELKEKVKELELREWQERPLLFDLKIAEGAIEEERDGTAIVMLEAFKRKIKLLCLLNKITIEERDEIIAITDDLIIFLRIPIITSIDPLNGQPGDVVEITGNRFGHRQFRCREKIGTVIFNGIDAGEAISWSDDRIEVIVPEGATSGAVVVTVKGVESNKVVFLVGEGEQPIQDVLPDAEATPQTIEDFTADPEIGLMTSRTRLIMCFNPDVTLQEATYILYNIEATIVGTLPSVGMLIIDIPDSPDLNRIEQALQVLEGNPSVEVATSDSLLEPTVVPSQTETFADSDWNWKSMFSAGNWGQKFAHFPGAWNLFWHLDPQTGETLRNNNENNNIATGVIDIAFDDDHEDLKGPVIAVNLLGEFQDFIPFGHNHGNHVTGIIGANFFNGKGVNGANPFAKMICFGYGGPLSNAAKKIETLINYSNDKYPQLRLKVINFSQGYNWYQKTKVITIPNVNVDIQNKVAKDGAVALKFAQLAAEKGIILVSAAGNDSSPDTKDWVDVDAQWSSPLNWAAAHGAGNVIVVAALRYYTSNNPQGGGVERRGSSNSGSVVNIAAPGERILSTVTKKFGFVSGYSYMSGTSQAAPLVTGLVGLMYAYNPNLTIDEVKDCLTSVFEADPYANGVVSSYKTTNPQNVIGNTNDFASVEGSDGYIIVDMGENEEVINREGNDFFVQWLTVFGNYYDQYATYYCSNSSTGPWYDVTSTNPQYPTDYHYGDLTLAGLSSARYLKIQARYSGNWALNLRYIKALHMNTDASYKYYTDPLNPEHKIPIIDVFESMIRIPGAKKGVADVTGDGDVTYDDWYIVDDDIDNAEKAYSRTDLNGDGSVDQADLDIIEEFLSPPQPHIFSDDFESYQNGELINSKPNWESSDVYYLKGWTVYETLINGKPRKVINFAPSPWPGGFPLGSNYATFHCYSPDIIESISLTIDYAIMPNSDMRAYISGDNQTWVDVTGVIGMGPSPIEDDWKSATVDLSSYITQANITNDLYVKFTGAAYSGSGWGIKVDVIIVNVN